MTMITPSYLGETIEYSSLHACRSTLEDPTSKDLQYRGTAGMQTSASKDRLQSWFLKQFHYEASLRQSPIERIYRSHQRAGVTGVISRGDAELWSRNLARESSTGRERSV